MMPGTIVFTANTTPSNSLNQSRSTTPNTSTTMSLSSLIGKAALGGGVVPINTQAFDTVRKNAQDAARKPC